MMDNKPIPQSERYTNTPRRLSLPDALIKGAIALHNHEQLEEKGNREPSFAVKTGVSYGVSLNGKTSNRIYIYATYAKTNKDKKTVRSQLKSAVRTKGLLHLGSLKGAFWFFASLSKRAIEKWGKVIKAAAKIMIYLWSLWYAIRHPELKDFLQELISKVLS